MERIRVSTLAKSLGISTTTVYKHMHRLKERLSAHVEKEGGITYLSAEGERILRNTIQVPVAEKVPCGMIPQPMTIDFSPMTKRLEAMEQAMLAMAEEVKASRREALAIRAEVTALRGENNRLRLYLEPPVEPACLVKPWQPKVKQDPLEGQSWLYRWWVSVTDPIRLRATES